MCKKNSKLNQECNNPYCHNQIIRLSPKLKVKYCKSCLYMRKIGMSLHYQKIHKEKVENENN